LSVGETLQRNQETASGRLAIRWLPPLLLLLGVVGIVAVLPSVNGDQGAREWYRGQIGGSSLYRLNVIFARLGPFIAGSAVALALLQRQRLRSIDRNDGETLKRHGLTEVLTHWLNAVGIGLGLITAAWLLKWIDNPVSLRTTFIIHFVGAGFTLAAVTHHLTYQLVGGQRGLLPQRRDLKGALGEVVAYAGVYRGVRGAFGIQLPQAARRPFQRLLRRFDIVPEPEKKYLATEKVISYPVWALLVGIVVVTGVIKALRYEYGMPAGLLRFVSFLHDGATIFILVFLIFHVAALVLVPRNWPLLKSMFTTRISRRYAQENLPLWTEELGIVPGPTSRSEEMAAAGPGTGSE
jgi:thiosulfate reductase cytochrome b subunit